ncbi:MAG: NAD-dependent epimerase/dehydratase family protein [Planctomycetota bacterium]
MRCLVTGATGFLGRHVVRSLLDLDYEVTALVRETSLSLEREGARLAQGDVLDRASVEAAVEGMDAVFHLAGGVRHRGETSELYQLHVEGTRNVLRAAHERDVPRAIHMSSSGTIAVSQDAHAVADESSPYATEVVRNWPYYLSKIYAEKVALQAGALVLCPSLLLGPGDERMSSTSVVLRFLNRELPAVPPGGINAVDVRDVARATAQAATRGELGQRYLLGGQNMTVEAFLVHLEKVTGLRAPALRAPQQVSDWTARMLGALEDVAGEGDESVAYAMAGHTWYLDASKAEEALGFHARPLEETLRDTVAYIRSRGPLPEPTGLLGFAVSKLRRAFQPGG